MVSRLRLLIVVSMILVPAAVLLGHVAPTDGNQFETEISAMEELYQAAKRGRFAASDTMRQLEERSEAFIANWQGKVSPATLATARAYRVRCWLAAEKHEEVFTEATALLETKGLSDDDRRKLLYYRGVSAIETDRREAAEASVEALYALEPSIAASLLGTITRKWKAVEVGKAPPPWTLRRIHYDDDEVGETLSLSSLRDKYVLLDFWATWCGPCRSVMKKELAPLHKAWGGDKRFELVSVGTNWRGDTAQKQADFAKKNGYRWTKVYDADGRVTASYGVRGIPTLTFIDPDGKVIAHGYARDVMPKVKAKLAELK